ncbi:hypothetical protein KAR91_02115 [Candidatus Pacearchaeota archaeon]|nr:hypothetical protein [Candidatus Pacearchaeota archaeon]
MPDFENHKDVLALKEKAQEADRDNREKVREVQHFLHKPDGQWEPSVINKMSGRPRYTFDQCNDIVDDIAGEMERADFGIKVQPAGGDATTDIAKTYNGLIRNIENISNAKQVYDKASRNMTGAGLAGWRVRQRWGETDSFEQDLYIDPMHNWVDRVWFDPAHQLETGEDANYCFVLTPMTKDDYKEEFPNGSNIGVSDDKTSEVYFNKAETILTGEFIYKVKVKREVVLMSDNSVYVVDEKFKSVADELKDKGITEVRRRTREVSQVKTRLFDGGDWLSDAQDTVFELLPLVPEYANFNVTEGGKITYWGSITKKMDAQRVYNYSESRKIEETALAPREKIIMTREQAANDLVTLATLNTNSDPMQLYTHVAGQPPPFKVGGASINPGLETTSNSALQNLRSGIGQVPNQPVGLRSGVAVELEQNKNDTKNIKYFTTREIAITHTCKVLINAIPKVYDTRREVRIIGQDGGSESVTLKQSVFDEQSQKTIELNDLSKGFYDVVCEMGPAFQNKQAETVAAFNEIASIDPTIIQTGKDIWFKNMTVPGMDAMAERARIQLFQQGLIPEDQMTDDEKEQLRVAQEQAANQPPQEDPLMIAAQAELMKAQTQAQEAQLKAQIDTQGVQLEQARLQLQSQKQQADQQKAEFEARTKQVEFLSKQGKEQAEALKTQTETLSILQNTLVKAQEGGITGPGLVQAFIDQANIVNEQQDNS